MGSGRFARPLGVSVGVDPSLAMGRLARARGVDVVRGVAEALPFGDRSFDGVLFVTTICFVEDLPTTLREARRVLRAGGTLLAGLVDRESSLGREYSRRRARSLFYRAATLYSTAELVRALRSAGFARFAFAQTLLGDLRSLREPEPVRPGYGGGSFVAIRAERGRSEARKPARRTLRAVA